MHIKRNNTWAWAGFITLVFIALVVMWFFFPLSQQPKTQIATELAIESQAQIADRTPDAAEVIESNVPNANDQSSSKPVRATENFRDDELRRKWGFGSDAELAWYKRHLFPTDSEKAVYPVLESDLPSDGIPKTARDLENAVYFTISQNDREEQMKGIRVLRSGALRGYLYAFRALAQAYSIIDPSYSQAYWRASQLLGDWAVAATLKYGTNAKYEEAYTILLAAKLVEEIEVERQRRGWSPLDRRALPGVEQGLEFIAAQARAEVSTPKPNPK